MTLLRQNLKLAADLARRDLVARNKRSLLGWLWLLLTPLCLLATYYVIFGMLFNVTWHGPAGSDGGDPAGFALPFFAGLTLYLFFADVVNSSTVVFTGKRDFVVKTAFPLWVLWLSNLLRAAAQASISLILVLLLALVQQRLALAGVGWAALSLVPTLIFIAGLSLALCALGPFIGDISEANRLLLRVLFYATPISYPVSLIPDRYQFLIWLNPLTTMVESLRASVAFGTHIPFATWGLFSLFALLLLALGAWLFNRVKGVVSDVV